jgi:hypothetical protein
MLEPLTFDMSLGSALTVITDCNSFHGPTSEPPSKSSGLSFFDAKPLLIWPAVNGPLTLSPRLMKYWSAICKPLLSEVDTTHHYLTLKNRKQEASARVNL